MKLDYFDLISPYPIEILKVGSIGVPTLRDIAKISYYTYSLYVSTLLLTPEEYFNEKEKRFGIEIDEDVVINTTKYDLILEDKELQTIITQALNFFFEEEVVFDDQNGIFTIIKKSDDNENEDNGIIIGFIGRQNYKAIVDIILQRLHIDSVEDEIEDLSKVKNMRGKKIYEKILKGRKKMRQAKAKAQKNSNNNLTLPNIISSVVAYCPNVNYIQVWDLTIYQLFDLFDRLKTIDQYNIASTQVAVWGDENNQFKFGLWNKNLHESNEEES